MMNLFPRCDYLRVIVATTLFGRIVDLENLDVLLDDFTQVDFFFFFLALVQSPGLKVYGLARLDFKRF